MVTGEICDIKLELNLSPMPLLLLSHRLQINTFISEIIEKQPCDESLWVEASLFKN